MTARLRVQSPESDARQPASQSVGGERMTLSVTIYTNVG